MELKNLNEQKQFNKINDALKSIYDFDFNYDQDLEHLEAVFETTANRIAELKESGISSDDKTFQKLLLIREGLDIAITKEKLMESTDLDQAEVLLAAKQMADDLQKMAEDLASMQVEDLMSITNAMKEEVGTAEAEQFNASAEMAISSALDAVKSANEQVTNAVMLAQGQPVETDMDMEEPEMDVDMDIDMEEPADDFEGADAAGDMSDETGREMKEDAYLSALKMVKEAQSDGKVSADLLQKAFAVIRAK